jgi:hypothetical protein
VRCPGLSIWRRAGVSSPSSLLDIAKMCGGEKRYVENCEMFYFVPRNFFAWF